VSHFENQPAVGSRSRSESLQAAVAQLKSQRSGPALVTPSGPVYEGALLKARDTVRLTIDMDGAPGGSEGVILGWYANEPENVIVSLSEGGVENLPRAALELVDVHSLA
jgi:hypothetical protein